MSKHINRELVKADFICNSEEYKMTQHLNSVWMMCSYQNDDDDDDEWIFLVCFYFFFGQDKVKSNLDLISHR